MIVELLNKKIVKIIISISRFSFLSLNFEDLAETFKINTKLGFNLPKIFL